MSENGWQRTLPDSVKLAIERMVVQVKSILAEKQKSEFARELFGGTVDFDPERPGTYALTVVTQTGIERYGNAQLQEAEDEQPQNILNPVKCIQQNEQVNHLSPWDVLRQAQGVSDRITAIDELVVEGDHRIPDYVVDTLERSDLPESWRDHLVFVSEDITVIDADRRLRLRTVLVNIAKSLRESAKSGTEQVVWSAIRRAVSLSEPDEIGWIMDFMQPSKVDTRLVAIQSVARKYESALPPRSADLEFLESRISALAVKYLDPDVFSAGLIASLAQNTILALVTLDSTRWPELRSRIQLLGKSWFEQQIVLKLQKLSQSRDALNRERIDGQIASFKEVATS